MWQSYVHNILQGLVEGMRLLRVNKTIHRSLAYWYRPKILCNAENTTPPDRVGLVVAMSVRPSVRLSVRLSAPLCAVFFKACHWPSGHIISSRPVLVLSHHPSLSQPRKKKCRTPFPIFFWHPGIFFLYRFFFFFLLTKYFFWPTPHFFLTTSQGSDYLFHLK